MPSDKKDNRPTSFRILSEHFADLSNPRPPNSFDAFLIIDWGQLEERVDEEARVRDRLGLVLTQKIICLILLYFFLLNSISPKEYNN